MRYIEKSATPPASIRDYIAAQTPVGHGLDYKTFSTTGAPNGGSRGGKLCRELTAEQCGLCAYTGAGIDARLGSLSDPNAKLKFSAHNEHMKPQSVCRDELTQAGKTPGVDLGEDMDHRNIVAALLVSGGGKKVSTRDLFGAAHRENEPVSVLPMDPTCESRFLYVGDGRIEPSSGDQAAADTIRVLHLDHGTLEGWRKQAIEVFVDGIQNRDDAERIIAGTTIPENGWLPEYCFAIRQLVQQLLDINP